MSKSSLYGDDIFIKEDTGTIILGIMAMIYALFGIIIACLIKKGSKDFNDIKNVLCSNEVQKQLRKIYDTIVADIKKNKEFKEYSKYFEYKNYSFNRKDIRIVNKNNNSKVIVPINILAIDADKIFKDVYGMSAVDYNKNWDDPDCCKPAPKFLKVLKEIDKICGSYIKTIKNGKNIGIDLYIEHGDWEDFEYYYDSYTYTDNEEILAVLEFSFDYNELKKKAEEAKNNPSNE